VSTHVQPSAPPPVAPAEEAVTDPEAGPRLDLPTDRPRPAVASGRRGSETLHGGSDLELAGDGSSDAALVAAMGILLHRYTGSSNPTFALGLGDRTIAVELDLEGAPSFRAVMDQARAAADGAQPAHRPQVVLALGQETDGERATDFRLQVSRDAVHAELDYDADLYGAATARRLLGHFHTILAAGLSEPDALAGELPLLTGVEQQVLLEEWNDTAFEFPSECVDRLVAAQASRTPDAVAVECDGVQLTYAELERRADRLASFLRGLGVGPDVLVGIAVERSVELVVGVLGILGAGGAYVPIDPAYPVDRQAFMLTDAAVSVVLTQQSLLESVPFGDARPLCLDRDWPEIERAEEIAPEAPRDPEQLAYVIYTSGSTGQPKGVEIPHRALANFLWTMRDRPGLEAEDVLVAVTTLSFDIAGLELYLPLVVGARVVVAARETAAQPQQLAELLERSGATVMQATPTTWRMLLDSGWEGRPGFRALCGGEALPVALAEELLACGIELWNMYGPTETTIWSTVAPLEPGEALTIGRPIGNTSLYILDPALRPLPAGVAGELYIGGAGLARGYRNRPDLTADRFVANPFGEGRIYRTGDLARYRHDGAVDYLGRLDHQVKVRGFRIELGEIETTLGRHDAVARAVCVARDDGLGPELVAYITPFGVPVSGSQLRRYLADRLPAYMVPSAIVSLSELPLTPNGKVDRKALPAPSRERDIEQTIVAPRTPLERQLAATWERVLGMSPIGVTDNFFDLGLTSMVAAQLFAAIEKELGGRLALGAMFRAPTIEALAQLIEDGDDGSRWSSLVPIRADGSGPPIFCVHGGAGTILHLEPLARRLGTDQPLYGLQSRGLYGGEPPLTTVEDMAAHYLSELRQLQPEGPYYFAGYCFGSIVAFEMAQRMRAEGQEVALLATFNGPSPSWIKTWGWHGNQPSVRARRTQAPVAAATRLTRGEKVRRAFREPRRIWTGAQWHLHRYLRRFDRQRARIALALGRPVPEWLRERYFLLIHSDAERAYEPQPYGGDLLVFYGEGLYEDPHLGWGAHVTGRIDTWAVPGEHTNNRQVFIEPHVDFVRDRLEEHLGHGAHVR
jgi:amino acid adenylation domain-containing protein